VFRPGRVFWALVLIAIGGLFLASELTNGAVDAGEIIGRWWPLLLVGLGLVIVLEAWVPRNRHTDVPVAVDLAGARQAQVRIDFGAGRLAVGPAAPGRLVDGHLGGGGRVESDGAGRVRLRADAPDWWAGGWPGWTGFDWHVGITREVPVALRVDGGASQAELDLGDLTVTDLEVHTGASETRVMMPRAAGMTRARFESGAASVRVRVPDGVAARISGTMAIGSAHVDERRFPRTSGFAGSASWESAGWETAQSRCEISFQGGLGGIWVE